MALQNFSDPLSRSLVMGRCPFGERIVSFWLARRAMKSLFCSSSVQVNFQNYRSQVFGWLVWLLFRRAGFTSFILSKLSQSPSDLLWDSLLIICMRSCTTSDIGGLNSGSVCSINSNLLALPERKICKIEILWK